jgi:hypothetical protein
MEKSAYEGIMLLNKLASIPFSSIESPSWDYRHFAAVHDQLSPRRKIESSQPIQFKPRATAS